MPHRRDVFLRAPQPKLRLTAGQLAHRRRPFGGGLFADLPVPLGVELHQDSVDGSSDGSGGAAGCGVDDPPQQRFGGVGEPGQRPAHRPKHGVRQPARFERLPHGGACDSGEVHPFG
ncbi:MAG: hypothetical protein WBA00_17550, partial [Rhodococcus sp. (in: high G+C Gram-positive bacteria)]